MIGLKLARSIDGYTLSTIHLCEEIIKRKFAVDEILEESQFCPIKLKESTTKNPRSSLKIIGRKISNTPIDKTTEADKTVQTVIEEHNNLVEEDSEQESISEQSVLEIRKVHKIPEKIVNVPKNHEETRKEKTLPKLQEKEPHQVKDHEPKTKDETREFGQNTSFFWNSQSKGEMTDIQEPIPSPNCQSEKETLSKASKSCFCLRNNYCCHRACQSSEHFLCSQHCCCCVRKCCSSSNSKDLEEEQEVKCSREETNKHGVSFCPCEKPQNLCAEDDPCEELFDAMTDTMEEAKSIEDVFGKYFTSCMEKIERLAYQMRESECRLMKLYNDLKESINHCWDCNSQQLQYLCVRMDNDRLFYQQQQKCFLKSLNRKLKYRDLMISKKREDQTSSSDNISEFILNIQQPDNQRQSCKCKKHKNPVESQFLNSSRKHANCLNVDGSFCGSAYSLRKDHFLEDAFSQEDIEINESDSGRKNGTMLRGCKSKIFNPGALKRRDSKTSSKSSNASRK